MRRAICTPRYEVESERLIFILPYNFVPQFAVWIESGPAFERMCSVMGRVRITLTKLEPSSLELDAGACKNFACSQHICWTVYGEAASISVHTLIDFTTLFFFFSTSCEGARPGQPRMGYWSVFSLLLSPDPLESFEI